MEDMSYAQAVGEQPIQDPAFVPGEDFDPGDHDEAEMVRMASETHAVDTISRLQRENAELRAELDNRDD